LATSRRAFLGNAGMLVVGVSLPVDAAFAASPEKANAAVRSVAPQDLDSWLAIAADGTVTAYTGRVDIGTGTETVFKQFVAEELDVALDRIHLVMGDTRLTPDKGKMWCEVHSRCGPLGGNARCADFHGS
jgi:nicotinate dehydrogenase subunit B